jgi:hypothetical protein
MKICADGDGYDKGGGLEQVAARCFRQTQRRTFPQTLPI